MDYRTLREAVGLVEFEDRGIVHLAGRDGAAFLQGLVTNEVVKLAEERGCAAAMLTPVGRIFSMMHVFRAGSDALYVLLQEPGATRVVDHLDRYRFNELVEIANLTGEMTWLSLQGPGAPAAAEAACGGRCTPEPLHFHSFAFAERTLRVARFDEAGVPGLHFLVRRPAAAALREMLETAAREHRGGPVARAAWEVCRVQAGVPWYGPDMDETVLPMEAGLHAILDTAKGCYVGQEVVARALVQGRTNWSLWGLRLPEDARLESGSELQGLTKPRAVVRVRSVVRPPSGGERLALAYVHREAARPGPLVVRDDQGAEVEIRLEPLPFAAETAREGPAGA
ncbi:MAG: folate-binding protein YgfZ [Gemmatimonadota bacterium]